MSGVILDQMNPTCDGNKEQVPITVKFKGSKLAMGSSRVASCAVDAPFMTRLTNLNKLMLEGGASVSRNKVKLANLQRKPSKNKRTAMNLSTGQKRNYKGDYGEFSDREAFTCNSPQYQSTSIGDHAVNKRRVGTVGSVRSPATGMLSVCNPTSTSSSRFYREIRHRKRFNRLLDGLEPEHMDITCAFDFWLWCDIQNYFATFSNKTHDSSVLSLQDIGASSRLISWFRPQLFDSFPHWDENVIMVSSCADRLPYSINNDRLAIHNSVVDNSDGQYDVHNKEPNASEKVHLLADNSTQNFEKYCPNNTQFISTAKLSGENDVSVTESDGLYGKDSSILNSELAMLNQLYRINLEVNQLLVALRRKIPEMHAEFDRHCSLSDTEKTIMAKWKKAMGSAYSGSSISSAGKSFCDRNTLSFSKSSS